MDYCIICSHEYNKWLDFMKSTNTYQFPGRVLSTYIFDANTKGKVLLWVGKVILKSQMHILDLQLDI